MSLESKIRSLKAHPLIQVLADNGGNPRTLVLIEPLWGVPYNLIAPFATLYINSASSFGFTALRSIIKDGKLSVVTAIIKDKIVPSCAPL